MVQRRKGEATIEANALRAEIAGTTLRLRVDGGWVGGGWVCGLGYRRCWTVGTDERTAEAGGGRAGGEAKAN